jgi:hypothetical protein
LKLILGRTSLELEPILKIQNASQKVHPNRGEKDEARRRAFRSIASKINPDVNRCGSAQVLTRQGVAPGRKEIAISLEICSLDSSG